MKCMYQYYRIFQLKFNLHYKLKIPETHENSSEQDTQQQNNNIQGYKTIYTAQSLYSLK